MCSPVSLVDVSPRGVEKEVVGGSKLVAKGQGNCIIIERRWKARERHTLIDPNM